MTCVLLSWLDEHFVGPGIPSTLSVALLGAGLIASGLLVGRRRQRAVSTRRPGVSLQTIAAMADPATVAPANEQREQTRRAGTWTRVTLMESQVGGSLFEGRVIDYDRAGLGLMLFKEVSIGQVLSVRPSRAPAAVPCVQVEVKSCRQVDKAVWRVGCRAKDAALFTLLRQYG
jgi:hypothetical protein